MSSSKDVSEEIRLSSELQGPPSDHPLTVVLSSTWVEQHIQRFKVHQALLNRRLYLPDLGLVSDLMVD